MTYSEIYNLICYKVWGDLGASPPPNAIATYLPQMIFRAHRKIQQDYNFWFMYQSYTFDTEAGVESYVLPDQYKEIIELRQQSPENLRYEDPLTAIQPEELRYRNKNLIQAQYAKYFCLMNNNLYLSPIPSEVITNQMYLWKFLALETTDDFEDALMLYGGSAIVNYVVSELKQDISEAGESNLYYQRFMDDVEQLKREDYRRRQSVIEDLEYHGV